MDWGIDLGTCVPKRPTSRIRRPATIQRAQAPRCRRALNPASCHQY